MTTLKTPGQQEEDLVEEASERGMSELTSPNEKMVYTHSQSYETIQWRPKTRASDKFQLNMKRVLNPELKNEGIIDVDESSREEDTKSKEMEEIFS